jgi:hypothetical protein
MANLVTSGGAVYNPQLTEIIEEAFERAGSELRSGYDMRTARRSLNLMFADWANRGINMWTMDQGVITLAQGQSTYALPSDTVDLLEHVIRTQANSTSNQADLTITRISVSTYATLPNKLQQARPIQVLVNRQDAQQSPTTITVASAASATDTTITLTSTVGLPAYGFVQIDSETIFYQYISGNTINTCARGQNNTTAASHAVAAPVSIQYLPSVTVWPIPDGSQQYQFAYWRLRRTQDAGNGVNVMDIPFRFLPAMVAGLAYYLILKLPPAPDTQTRLQVLKAQYDEAWQLASDEDREKAAVRFVPRQMYIGNSY